MSDWIDQLERLTRLRSEGALTEREFAEQKAKLLAASEPAVSDGRAAEPAAFVPADEPPAGPGKGALIAGGIAVLALVLAGAAWFGSSLIQPGSDPALSAAPSAAVTTPPAAVPTPTETKPAPVALDGALAFANPAECLAGDTLERVYKKLDAAMELGSGRGLTVKLDAWDAPLAISARNATDKDQVYTADAEIRFPDDSTWHGLKLTRITARRYAPPDTDSSYTRTVNFAEPTEKVQRTLARLGFGVQAGPGYVELPGTDSSCGGSMQLETIAGGSQLSCGWGC